jgi:hypothetical protein
MSRRVHFTFDIAQNVSVGVFYQEALKRDLPRLLTDGWPTTAKLDESAAIWWSVEPHGTTALLEPSAGSLASVHVGFGNVFVQVAASDIESARLGMEEVRKLLPRAEQDREGRVPVTFWSYSPHGQGLSRFLNVVDGLIGQGLAHPGPRDDERGAWTAPPRDRQARPLRGERTFPTDPVGAGK